MHAVWIDVSVGEIIDEVGEPTEKGEETVVMTEKPKFTERLEIGFSVEIFNLSPNVEILLMNELSASIQRINRALIDDALKRAINNTKDSDGELS